MQNLHPILIIESDKTVSTMMADILGDEGYMVVAAHDRVTTQACIKTSLPALVLLDAWQPQLTPAAVRSLLRHHYHALPPVVITTTNETSAFPAISADALPRLQKPFTIDSLLTCVATYVAPRDTHVVCA